jgi:hypothetical protein
MCRKPASLFLSRPIALFATLAWALAESSGRADLRFEAPFAQVGTVRAGPLLVHRFACINDGADPVEITGTRGSCGCLKPHLSRTTVPPGERAEVVLEVNTLSQAAGPHTWTVRVTYQSGNTTFEIPLQLSARLVTELMVQPASLVIFADRSTSHQVVITDSRPQPLAVTAVRASSPKLDAQATEPVQDGRGRWVRAITLRIADDYPDGRHDEVLQVFSDDPAYRTIGIPVTVIRRSQEHVTVSPSAVQLTAAKGQPFPARVILIRANGDEGVQIESVLTDDPAVTCQWAQGPGVMATLKVRVNHEFVHGHSLHSTVTVHLRRPAPEVLTIPVTCTEQE